MGVLVTERPVDHVGHGLEAPVRVPRRAPGLTRCVVDRAHLVHMDEGVEVAPVDPGEGRRTGKPSPSKPEGAVVTETTRRSLATAASGSGTRGRASTFSTLIAGMPPV